MPVSPQAVAIQMAIKGASPVNHLIPTYINPETGTFHNSQVRFGGMADVFYQYLLKVCDISAIID